MAEQRFSVHLRGAYGGAAIFRSPESYLIPHRLVNGERIKGFTPTP
jgi:hypothetical protein